MNFQIEMDHLIFAVREDDENIRRSYWTVTVTVNSDRFPQVAPRGMTVDIDTTDNISPSWVESKRLQVLGHLQFLEDQREKFQ